MSIIQFIEYFSDWKCEWSFVWSDDAMSTWTKSNLSFMWNRPRIGKCMESFDYLCSGCILAKILIESELLYTALSLIFARAKWLLFLIDGGREENYWFFCSMNKRTHTIFTTKKCTEVMMDNYSEDTNWAVIVPSLTHQ